MARAVPKPVVTITSLLYQELDRNAAPVRERGKRGRLPLLDEHGRLPVVLPVVLYNGETPWRAAWEVSELVQPARWAPARHRPWLSHWVLDERHVAVDDLPDRNLVTAVVWLERIRSPGDLIQVTRMLRQWLRSPEDDELRRVFAAWMREIAEPFVPRGETLPPEMTLEGIEMTVVERAAEWSKERIREGLAQGIAQGLERGLTQGLEQGLTQGLEQGLAHERALLHRQAASRFGGETADRLAPMLAGVSDPERLAEVGEWLVRCATGEEFLSLLHRMSLEAS